MLIKKFAVASAALALAAAAGTAAAQCDTYNVSTGSASIDPNVSFVGGACDDCITSVAMPFSVNLYGVPYSTVNVSSNGNMQFETFLTNYYNDDCTPAATLPGATIMPHWDDFWLVGGGISTGVSGAPGSQVFTIQWQGEYYNSGSPILIQCKLFENSSRIEFHYGSIDQNGSGATVGIHDNAGHGQMIQCLQATLSSGMMMVLDCAPPTDPSGTGSASPNRFMQGSSTLLTVGVTPAQIPPSTGITVRADLSSVGGSATQTFYDDGSNGDLAAGDNVFSYLAVVNTSGPQTLPFTVTDAQARTATGNINFAVLALENLGALPETATMVTPFDLADSEVRWFKFTVPDIQDAARQYLDIWSTSGGDTELGLYREDGSVIAYDDDGDSGALSQLSFGLMDPARPGHDDGYPFDGWAGDLPAGTYFLAAGTFNTTFGGTGFNVTSTGPATSGYGITLERGTFNQPYLIDSNASGLVGTDVLLAIQAFPGMNPASTTMTVTADMSSIGGSATQVMYDDGTHGDTAAGDGMYSYLATIAHEPTQTAGTFAVAVNVVDDLSRSGSGTITVVLAPEARGACCISGECTTTTQYLCLTGSGSYSGDGTSCNVGPNPAEFASIAGTGALAGTVSGCDDCTESVALPFTFNFFGNDYTNLYISSNGNLQFNGAPSAAYFNGIIPSPDDGLNDAIYPMWDDFNPGSQGDIYFQVDGTSPNQTFTVEWNNVTQFNSFTSETFQVVLHEGSNNIEFRYGTISASRTDNIDNGTGQGPGGDDYTIGIENADGTVAHWIGGVGLGTGGTSRLLNSNVAVVSCGGSCPGNVCGPQDYNGDGDSGTDQDIEAFFACLGGTCCPTCFCQGSDFNGDGDFGTDQDIEAFFRVLGGNPC